MLTALQVGLWTNSPEMESECKKEFAYACKVATPHYMFPVVLDKSLDWAVAGPVGRVLGAKYFETLLDLSSTDDDGQVLSEIVEKVVGMVEELKQGKGKEARHTEEGSQGTGGFDTMPSIIESLQQLVGQEKQSMEAEVSKMQNKDGGESNLSRFRWIQDRLGDLILYEKVSFRSYSILISVS